MFNQVSRAIMLFPILGFSQINAEDIPHGIMPKRQAAGTGATSSSSSSSTSPTSHSSSSVKVTSISTIPTTVKVVTTNPDGKTTTKSVSTDSLTTQTTTKKNSFVTLGSTTLNAATLDHTTVVSHALVTKQTSESTFTSYWTSNGDVHSAVYTTKIVSASTTGFAATTIAPSLADGGGNGSNLSTNTKAVIGGVVGGIGGAAAVGAMVFALWRVWRKKKEQQDDDYPESYAKSNRESAMTFSSEGYSNPGGRVNTASNF